MPDAREPSRSLWIRSCDVPRKQPWPKTTETGEQPLPPAREAQIDGQPRMAEGGPGRVVGPGERNQRCAFTLPGISDHSSIVERLHRHP